jgi:septum formation protein
LRPTLVLASGSPRRRELLRMLGLDFVVRPADVDETPRAAEDPAAYVLRLAQEKASTRAEPGEVVLGADTTVVLDGDILGKPQDAEEARAMLRRLAAREHLVLTGVALRDGTSRRLASAVERTLVRMAAMTEAEIAWYVATGEPTDKAGAYAVQGIGALFVEQELGNHGNVVGLPLPLLRRLLDELDHPIASFLAAAEEGAAAR